MNLQPGVLNAHEAKELFKYAKENNFALPAINIVNSEVKYELGRIIC